MLFAVGNQREPAAREPRTAVGSEKVLKTRTGCRRLEMRRGGHLLRVLLADVSFGEIGAQSQDRPLTLRDQIPGGTVQHQELHSVSFSTASSIARNHSIKGPLTFVVCSPSMPGCANACMLGLYSAFARA
jgi:hypothetical protein